MSTINVEHNHVFIHVPKCAGTSMERQSFVGGNGHVTAAALRCKAPPGMFFWGFVRHPADRLRSSYTRQMAFAEPHFTVAQAAGFEDYVLRNARFFRRRAQTIPMVEFLCWPSGRLAVDFVGRFENLNEDWREVCNRIGVEHVPLEPTNRSVHPLARMPWQELFTPAMRRAVADVYGADLETFGYDL